MAYLSRGMKAIKDDLSLIQRRAIQLPSFIIIY